MVVRVITTLLVATRQKTYSKVIRKQRCEHKNVHNHHIIDYRFFVLENMKIKTFVKAIRSFFSVFIIIKTRNSMCKFK